MGNMPIHQFMSEQVVSVARGTPTSVASEVMLDAGVSTLVLVDGKRPCGILSQKDLSTLCMLILTGRDQPSDERLAHDDFFTLPFDADSDEAWELMQRERCRQVVVVNAQGELAGLLTQTDLLHAKVSLIETQRDHLEQCVCERTRELHRSNEKLSSLLRIDPLLGIGNRRAMDEELLKLVEIAKRYRRPYAVALIDVDHFKLYNDLYGHQAGDAALIDIAHLVKRTTRASDTVYRYGGGGAVGATARGKRVRRDDRDREHPSCGGRTVLEA